MPKPNVTMFFPAYNEEENIPQLLNSAVKILDEAANKYEILVVVYEGSSDDTIDIVKKYAKKNKKIKLVIQPKTKKGVGYANIMGFNRAKYENVFYADSDNQFDLSEFKRFLPYIDEYDIIAGYRIKRQDPKTRIIVARIYNLMMRALFGVKERDLDCAFRLVKKKVLKNVKLICRTGLGTTEILAKARKKGYKIKEIGVNHYPRKFGKSVFGAKGLSLPKPREVYKILKEIRLLRQDLNK